MPRLMLLVVALAGLAIGGLSVALIKQPTTGLDEAAVRTIVNQALAERVETSSQDTAALNAAQINPMIESYLTSNPRVLERMSAALKSEIDAEQRTASRAAIEGLKDKIFNDPAGVVLGNPNGDVTLVEMFDYNCGYCRQALPDLANLIAQDPNLKVVLKEFPILSQGSEDAARVAVLVADSDVDYWRFHQALFTSRGQVTKETALKAASDLGLNPIELEMEMGANKVSAVIQTSYEIAQALKITGTPAFIIGDEVIPGAVGVDELRRRIENMRDCGATECIKCAGDDCKKSDQ